jgi:hypothetical protein
MKQSGEWNNKIFQYLPPEIDIIDDAALIPTVRDPNHLLVVIAGGEIGRSMAWISGWGYNMRAITVKIEY